MEVVKDLTGELAKAEAKDRFYEIQLVIKRLLAPQHYKRPFEYLKSGWGEVKRLESIVDGAPKSPRAPRKKIKSRKGEWELKTGDCWTFKYSKKNGELFDPSKAKTPKDWKGVKIIVPWGTNFGIFKKSLRRSLEAQRRLRYDAAPLALMKVHPVWLCVGEGPPESIKEGKEPEVILETRHTSKGDVMVEVFFDYIEDRRVKFFVEVDSECPINEEKFVALVKTLNTLDVIGPSKRGDFRVLNIREVKVSEEEIQSLLTKPELSEEPTKPVVY